MAVKTGLYKYKYNYETIKNFRKKSVRNAQINVMVFWKNVYYNVGVSEKGSTSQGRET